ncbi:WXG100 family type VII secretion target [Rathayibacter sp. AY1D2]|uniref:WXG100 family type VII secretion target n=1 Tax=Rathayibacter sp. AY1D2 TaxID=2080543 RepID=UPI0011AFFA85|nr:WXG100 family type VII secretion target [Rathayibacter sp. AY1D2]
MAQLRDLARRLQSASDQLNGSRQRIGSGIRIAAWVGPVAVRFRMLWDSEYSRQVQGASDALERISRDVLKQAEQQERASARDGGAAGSGGRSRPTVPWLTPLPSPWITSPEDIRRRIEAIIGMVGSGSVLAEWLLTLADLEEIKTSPLFGRILLPVGTALSTISVLEAIEDGDVVAAWLEGTIGGTSAVIGGLGQYAQVNAAALTASLGPLAPATAAATARAAGLGVVGFGVTALKGLIDFSLPYTEAKQAETYDQGVMNQFGPGVDPKNLSAEQAAAMSRRYEGWGVGNMISDQMQASGNAVRRSIEDTGYRAGGLIENARELMDRVFRR